MHKWCLQRLLVTLILLAQPQEGLGPHILGPMARLRENHAAVADVAMA